MTVVGARDFYEYLIQNDTAECEGCGKEMQIPDGGVPDAGMKEPFWKHEEVHTYIGGNFDEKHAYCEKCIQKEVDA
ncbi:MAG: hypothetical protein ABEJ02_02945 [Candidatus Paceibacteria bacterium]